MKLRRAFCIALIALGGGLDAYFYAFRFLADGTILPVAIGASLALELLLAFAVWHARESRIFAGVAVAVTLYAIVQTSAGQTFSLLSREAFAGNMNQVSTGMIDENQKYIARLDDEATTINKQLQSIKTTEDRATYGLTIAQMTRRLSDISRERATVSNSINQTSARVSKDEKEKVKLMSIYDFYSSMPTWGGMDWLKFIFHTLLSILIALMTPIGILTWNKKTDEEPEKTPVTRKEIDEFVTRCWKKIRQGGSNKIISEPMFYDWIDRDGIPMALNIYPELFQRCIDKGIITADGTALERDEPVIKRKLFKGAR